ncbi:MAG: rhodanese-like domain-containing protein [Saprospiraceae bacterium]|nr:rhodanese-like domain-containing protein [Saprospiraceae bacterium]MBK8670098.1 rhodanese-like domain-containing protein [Saprospiraceae bacterium]
MFDFLKTLFSSAPAEDLTEIISRKPFLVDVRTPGEFAAGHPKGAVNIPLDRVAASIDKFKGKKDVVVFCRSGNRSSQAKAILQAKGIQNVVDGGPWENVAQYTG